MENKNTPALVLASAILLSFGIGLLVNAAYHDLSSSAANVLVGVDYRCEELEQKSSRGLTADEKEWYERNCKNSTTVNEGDEKDEQSTSRDRLDNEDNREEESAPAKPQYNCDELQQTTRALSLEEQEWFKRNCFEIDTTQPLTCEEFKRKILSGQSTQEMKEDYHKRCETTLHPALPDRPIDVDPTPVDPVAQCDELKKLMELGRKEAAEKYRRLCVDQKNKDTKDPNLCLQAERMCSVIEKILAKETSMSDEAKKRLMELCKSEQAQDASLPEGPTLTNTSTSVSFTDTDPESVEGKAAEDLRERGLVNGFEDGTFRGKDLVTRAQALKILLVGKFGELDDIVTVEEEEKIFEQFRDLGRDDWSKMYFILGEKLGVVNGFGDGTIRPQEPVTTEQFLKMMAKVFDLPSDLPHSYKDVTPEDWVYEWAGAAEEFSLFPERKEYLQPKSYLTRKDVVVALYQYFKYLGE